MYQELQWISQTQLQPICSELRTNLQHCLLFMSKSKAGNEEIDETSPLVKLKDSRLVQFESPECVVYFRINFASKDMRGFVVLEGCNVSEAVGCPFCNLK